MTETSQTRESLNLRINSKIKADYENRIYEKYGRLEPYTGTELERELRVLLGRGELSEVVDRVHELARSLGEQSSENKKSEPIQSGDSEVVGYRVHSSVRAAIMKTAQEATDVTYASEMVESVMWAYACGRQSETKVTDRLERIDAFIKSQTSDKDAKTRRTDTIIDSVTPSGFTIEDFDQAVDEEVVGISSGRYARSEYLPRVLEETDYTYNPTNPELFRPIEEVDLSKQDPREKLPFLRDEADKIDIIRLDALETAASGTGNHIKYTPADAVAALGGGESQAGVQNLFDQVASNSDDIRYTKEEGYLQVKTEGAMDSIAERHNKDRKFS